MRERPSSWNYRWLERLADPDEQSLDTLVAASRAPLGSACGRGGAELLSARGDR